MVKIILSSSVRGGGLRFCRRGFNRRLIFVFVDAVSTVRPIFVFVDAVSTVRPILSIDNRFDIKIKLDTIEDV